MYTIKSYWTELHWTMQFLDHYTTIPKQKWYRNCTRKGEMSNSYDIIEFVWIIGFIWGKESHSNQYKTHRYYVKIAAAAPKCKPLYCAQK